MLISIFLWYGIEEVFEITKALLELALLGEVDLSLIKLLLMSIATLAGILAICKGFELRTEVEICIFTNSLIDATMQDGGTRERSAYISLYLRIRPQTQQH